MPTANSMTRPDRPIQKQIGQRMQQARLEARGGKGFTQEELAQKLEVSPITLSRWETGTRSPSFEMLERFADNVGKTLSYFFESEPRDDDYLEALYRLAKDLNIDVLKEVLEYMRFRYQRWYNEQSDVDRS